MPEINDRPKNRACYQCLVWWYARKKFEQASYEAGAKAEFADKGNWAGYHRWMNSRRAQEVREMTVSEFIEREYVSGVEVKVDLKHIANSDQ